VSAAAVLPAIVVKLMVSPDVMYAPRMAPAYCA
jgi:hypothetical protein